MRGALRNIGREDLAPVWARIDITTEEIGVALSVSGSAVSRHARKVLGLPPRGRGGGRRPSGRGDPLVFGAMFEAGVSAEEMRHHFGYLHPGSVSHRARALGLPPRKGRVPLITMAEYRAREREFLLAYRMRAVTRTLDGVTP